jgi:hypothetical protein
MELFPIRGGGCVVLSAGVLAGGMYQYCIASHRAME